MSIGTLALILVWSGGVEVYGLGIKASRFLLRNSRLDFLVYFSISANCFEGNLKGLPLKQVLSLKTGLGFGDLGFGLPP